MDLVRWHGMCKIIVRSVFASSHQLLPCWQHVWTCDVCEENWLAHTCIPVLYVEGAANYIFPAVSSWNFSNTLQPFATLATLVMRTWPHRVVAKERSRSPRSGRDVRYVHYSQPSSYFALGLILLTRTVAPTCTAQHFPTIFPTLVIPATHNPQGGCAAGRQC